jgi:hypothetical protein
MAQQKFQQQPVPILEWHYAADTLPVATDSNSQTEPTDRRQDKDKQTDKALLLTDNDTPTTYVATQPTNRQADRPTTTVVFIDPTLQKVVTVSARWIVIAVVAGGVLVGVAYILIEVVTALAALATQAAVLVRELVKCVLWLLAGVVSAFAVYHIFFSPNDTPPTRQGNSNNGEGGNIIVNIHSNNGNQNSIR